MAAKHVFVRSLLTGAMAPATLTVNGKTFTIPNGGEVVPLPTDFVDAARNSNLPLSFVDDEEQEAATFVAPEDAPSAGAAGGGVGGSSPAAGETFDAGTILSGNVAAVSESVALMNAAELDATESSEKSGSNRAGVLKAITEARAALAKDA